MKIRSLTSQQTETEQDPIHSFEHFFHTYYPILFKVGYQICADKELTKDLLQSFFLELWETQFQSNSIKYLESYLKKAFYRKVVKELQKENNAQKKNRSYLLTKENPSYENLLINLDEQSAQKKEQLKEALGRLSEQQRKVIELRFYEGLDYEEIAQFTGNQKQTIYNQMHTAIRKLKKYLLFFLV